MKFDRAILLGLLMLSWVGCAEDMGSAIDTPCGEGEAIEVEGEPLCVFERGVVIETGFRCPEGMPHEHLGGDVVVCSNDPNLPDDRVDRAEDIFLERRPETPRFVEPDPEPEPQPEPNPEPEPCADNDGDGFCPEDGDCNDDDPAINPGVSEDLLDGLDNDCDGQIDEDQSPPDQCRSNDDCAPGQACQNGVCRG